MYPGGSPCTDQRFLVFFTDEINPVCKMFISGIFLCLLYTPEKKLVLLSSSVRKPRVFLGMVSIKVLG